MTATKITAQIAAAPAAVYDLISDPTRLHEWDVTYGSGDRPSPGHDGAQTFTIERTIENRGIHLNCVVEAAEPGSRFAFSCRGSAGETVEERFTLRAKDGGTEVNREQTFRLPGQNLGVITQQTYAEALSQRSVEQAFARLDLAFAGGQGGGQGQGVRRPGDTDTRSEDTGWITSEEDYSPDKERGGAGSASQPEPVPGRPGRPRQG